MEAHPSPRKSEIYEFWGVLGKGVYRSKCRGGAKFFLPPLGAPRGRKNSNCKFITLGFLDIRLKYKILKRHTYSPNNYLLSIVSKKSTVYYTFIGIFSI